ncbi:hemolysin family protein [Fulvimarina sp. 2208YS6-2-32]|uniref:Hemolysin family protein n=1 Tax=Fulvimarina uroteuthidis TaxID=3098149 RepID=A0ABU5HXS1_9HYPH|nr:hemolysin family protein [Fulvimarina sp. 2208YS6-2-32]MDY8107568.1 hemolysin family protein [Fulvimarina sp. 2208YS6-2-32]
MAFFVIILVICAMLLGNAFYVAAEFAAVSASKPKLEAKAEDGNAEARFLERTVTDEYRMDRYIACAQVGITLTSLVIGVYGQRALMPYVGPPLDEMLPDGWTSAVVGAPLILIVLTTLQVIFGELFPKSIALRSPERTAMGTARPMRWSLFVLGPFISLLNGSAIFVMRRLGLDKPKEAGDEHSHDELRQLIEDSLEGGEIKRDAHEMLRQVLAFQDRTVSEVMVPRVRVKFMTPEPSAAEALRQMLATPFTRFPVIDNAQNERPVGFVHIREVFELSRRDPDASIEGIIRPVQTLPDSLTLAEVWSRLDDSRATIAVVFNEYGIVSGIVSVEDLVEEIIGEVVDEFDEEAPRIHRRDDRVVLRGDLPVREVNRTFAFQLPEDRADSMSGLIGLKLGVKDGKRGSKVAIGGVDFTVESVENGLPRLVSFPSAATSVEAPK